MLALQTNTEAYWTEHFQLTPDDLDFIFNLFLEIEKPISTPELIRRLIDFRIRSEIDALKKHYQKGQIFQPQNAYEVDQTVLFPRSNFAVGTVVSKREANNPEAGSFTAVTVAFDDGQTTEYASELTSEHTLNSVLDFDELMDARPDAKGLYNRYKRHLTPIVVDTLREQEDAIFIAKRWFLKSLLLEVNIAHLHLAEAILDINEGGPVSTETIADQADFGEEENPILRQFSLDYALSEDERFDEVGPAGQVMWFLKRMEPPEILEVPRLLRYRELAYDPDILDDEMLDIEEAIDDERSTYELMTDSDTEEATVTLIYPHLQTGTLPLSQRAEEVFPIAYRTPRIRVALVDAKTGDEMEGWVVRENAYIFGLQAFYDQHDVVVGSQLQLRPSQDDETKILVDYDGQGKARNQYAWVAKAEDSRLRFSEGQVSVATGYDDLMVLGVDDPASIDALSKKYKNRDLSAIIMEIIGGLAQFSPQYHVHCKTLYSAVNLLRRCPPAPIFATLMTNPAFANTGGPFWRLA